MPDSRSHRGAHPRDAICFAADQLPVLRTATSHLSWLLSRGYPQGAAAELVGNRFALRARQRDALQRCAASDQACARRRQHQLAPADLAGRRLLIDGYNVLLTVEAALGGGVVLGARDGVFRDLSAMSRHYRRVAETRVALEVVGECLGELGCGPARWLLDRPISNSAKLARMIVEVAQGRGWAWEAELVADPDRILRTSEQVVATADSAILDRCASWLNLARLVVEQRVPNAWQLDLGAPPPKEANEDDAP